MYNQNIRDDRINQSFFFLLHAIIGTYDCRTFEMMEFTCGDWSILVNQLTATCVSTCSQGWEEKASVAHVSQFLVREAWYIYFIIQSISDILCSMHMSKKSSLSGLFVSKNEKSFHTNLKAAPKSAKQLIVKNLSFKQK